MEGINNNEEVMMRIIVSSKPLTKFRWCVRERVYGLGGGGSLLETDRGPKMDRAVQTQLESWVHCK